MRRWPHWSNAGLLVAVAGIYPLLAPPAHRIDQRHFEQITAGMTREQVESIFGVPLGNYDWAERDESGVSAWRLRMRRIEAQWVISRVHAVYAGVADTAVPEPVKRPQRSTWTSRHGSFDVWFDEHQRVVSKLVWAEVRIAPPWQRWWRSWKER